ncbi:MAG: sodium/solute symporter [Planctomycetes bacterium]|nr:sodium/solute symporter [Planctomycetota bacterium]
MPGVEGFVLSPWDYATFGAYVAMLCAVGYWAGRRERKELADYFLAGRTLPWYVVGGSFIASNISSEHFIGMIGSAYVYGICVAMWEWGNIFSFSVLIWFFIPFLLAAKVFTTPEFLERRFNPTLRLLFAVMTTVSNVVAFMAAVLYGGGLALSQLFGWDLWFAILALSLVAGGLAIYGGLRSVAWTDFATLIIMVVGGLLVTVLGLLALSGESRSLVEGFRVMLERNQARSGEWAEAVSAAAPQIAGADSYNRLSVFQPATHKLAPFPTILFAFLSVSIWYNVINQFMIQRVLGAKNMYHARMGIVMAGYMKILMPVIVVVPGLILFALDPSILKLPWDQVAGQADRSYVRLLQTLIPIGLRGLFLAALFGAIQSTVNSVLNSTATIFTVDIYQRLIRPKAPEKQLLRVGIWSSVAFLLLSVALAWAIGTMNEGLFVYIQGLYAFLAPPFAAVFLLAILFRRINAAGATAGVIVGYALGILIKVFIELGPGHPAWLEPFLTQATVNWVASVVACIAVSLLTPRPRPEQVSNELTINWRRLNILSELGTKWYNSVVLWWLVFAGIIVLLATLFSGLRF